MDLSFKNVDLSRYDILDFKPLVLAINTEVSNFMVPFVASSSFNFLKRAHKMATDFTPVLVYLTILAMIVNCA